MIDPFILGYSFGKTKTAYAMLRHRAKEMTMSNAFVATTEGNLCNPVLIGANASNAAPRSIEEAADLDKAVEVRRWFLYWDPDAKRAELVLEGDRDHGEALRVLSFLDMEGAKIDHGRIAPRVHGEGSPTPSVSYVVSKIPYPIRIDRVSRRDPMTQPTKGDVCFGFEASDLTAEATRAGKLDEARHADEPGFFPAGDDDPAPFEFTMDYEIEEDPNEFVCGGEVVQERGADGSLWPGVVMRDRDREVTLRCNLIQANQPTANGRIYTTKALEQMKRWPVHDLPVVVGYPSEDRDVVQKRAADLREIRIDADGRLLFTVDPTDEVRGIIEAMGVDHAFEVVPLVTATPHGHGPEGQQVVDRIDDFRSIGVVAKESKPEIPDEPSPYEDDDNPALQRPDIADDRL